MVGPVFATHKLRLSVPPDFFEVPARRDKKNFDSTLRRYDLLLCKPGRILDRLLEVGRFEIGVAGKDLIDRRAVGNLADNDRDGDTHPANAGLASHHLGIECDPIELWHRKPFHAAGR